MGYAKKYKNIKAIYIYGFFCRYSRYLPEVDGTGKAKMVPAIGLFGTGKLRSGTGKHALLWVLRY